MTRTITYVRKMSMLLAIATTLVATPVLILTPQLTLAQQGQDVYGIGTGQVQCPSGISPAGDENILFGAFKRKGTIDGNFNVQDGENNPLKFGFFTGGHIGGKQFTLKGIEYEDVLCSSPVPTTVTITGQCGQGVTIQLRASNGETGEFVGNVACAK